MTDRERIDAIAAWMGWERIGSLWHRPDDWFQGEPKLKPKIGVNWRSLNDIALVEAEIVRRGLGQQLEFRVGELVDRADYIDFLTASVEVRARACELVIRDNPT